MNNLYSFISRQGCNLVKFALILLLLSAGAGYCQEPDTLYRQEANPLEEQMEYSSEHTDAETDFSELEGELESLKRKQVNLNSTDANELKRLLMLNELQLQNLLAYTREFGQLASIYELQVVDGFNEEVVRQMLPYICLSEIRTERFSAGKILRYGRPDVLARYQRVPEKQQAYSGGSDSLRSLHPDHYYLGGPDALYLRFLFSYRDQFQAGILGEKDPGEPFLPKADSLKKGFDFYSAHLYLKDAGKLKYLALGDYQLQFGQGLTLWSGLSLGSSTGALPSRRRAAEVRAHTSANESSFFRGIAATVSLGKFWITGFYSNRKRDANLLKPDSASSEEEFVSSIQQTGFHRTPAELADKNALREIMAGGHAGFNGNRFRVGLTAWHSVYDKPFRKQSNEYSKFEITGLSNTYAGLDYSYSYKRLTLYGEGSGQQGAGIAFLQGLSFTPDPRLSLALLYRNYQASYSNPFSSAFGQGSGSNEKGLYLGMTALPLRNFSLTAFVDYFRYPWLHYRVDAPSSGEEYSVQMSYSPGIRCEMKLRYRLVRNPLNYSRDNSPLYLVSFTTRQSWQWQFSSQALPWLRLESRVYLVRRTSPLSPAEQGYFLGQDLLIKPLKKRYSVSLRYALFDTDSYDTRIYAYESDVPGSFSVPALSGKGSRFCLLLKMRLMDRCDLLLRFSRTLYPGVQHISEGPARIEGDRKTELKACIRLKL